MIHKKQIWKYFFYENFFILYIHRKRIRNPSVSSQHSNHADVWVGDFNHGVGVPWKVICSETWLACLQLSTTTVIGGDDLTGTGDRDRTLARWKQACDFQQYLRIWLLLAIRSVDFNGTFVWANGVGWFLSCNVACDFQRYLWIWLLPTLQSLDLNGTFVWANVNAMLSQHCSG